jgi:hypothetical protein
LSVVYFTDRDLGIQFPAILADAGLAVERHVDHFSPTCPDEVWLEAVGKQQWVAVTHDRHIRYKPNERDAVIRHNVRLLVIIGAAPLPHLAENFMRTEPRINKFLARHAAPFIAKVSRPSPAESARHAAAPGAVTLWYPSSVRS